MSRLPNGSIPNIAMDIKLMTLPRYAFSVCVCMTVKQMDDWHIEAYPKTMSRKKARYSLLTKANISSPNTKRKVFNSNIFLNASVFLKLAR